MSCSEHREIDRHHCWSDYRAVHHEGMTEDFDILERWIEVRSSTMHSLTGKIKIELSFGDCGFLRCCCYFFILAIGLTLSAFRLFLSRRWRFITGLFLRLCRCIRHRMLSFMSGSLLRWFFDGMSDRSTNHSRRRRSNDWFESDGFLIQCMTSTDLRAETRRRFACRECDASYFRGEVSPRLAGFRRIRVVLDESRILLANSWLR